MSRVRHAHATGRLLLVAQLREDAHCRAPDAQSGKKATIAIAVAVAVQASIGRSQVWR